MYFFFRSIFLFTFINNCKVAGLVIFATIIECLFSVSTLIIQEYIPKILVSSYFICVYQCFKNKQNYLCISQVLIFRANQWTGFYMIRTSILKEFNTSKINVLNPYLLDLVTMILVEISFFLVWLTFFFALVVWYEWVYLCFL